MRTVWIFREKIINLSSGAHVLHETYLANSCRCQNANGTEMYTSVERTCSACRAFVFAR